MPTHQFRKRILKEYRGLQSNLLPGITLVPSETEEDDTHRYLFEMTLPADSDGVLHPIYKSDVYYLQILITPEYPVDSPQVQFIKANTSDSIPMHPHIYGNGHICLDLLGTGWTPACSIESILLSIQLMLSTNQLYERPPDDASYVKHAPLNPKHTTFGYHDDSI